MLRSRALGCLIVLVAAGCGRPAEGVYVDVQSVLTSQPAAAHPGVTLPRPPSPLPAQSLTVPGRPAESLSDPSNTGKQTIGETIAASQQKAYRKLVARLHDFYQTEVARFGREQEKQLDVEQRKIYDSIALQVRKAFEDYADKRLPLAARLALLAGAPDPNPQSNPPPNTAKRFTKERYAEAKSIREQMASLEKAFDAEAVSLLASAEEQSAIAAGSVRLKIELFRSQLDKKADEEARRQVEVTPKELGLVLATPEKIQLKALAPVKVSVNAEPPLPAAPEVGKYRVMPAKLDPAAELDHQLKIWLAINNYHLVPVRGLGRDATEEFRDWKKQHEPGR